MSVPPFMKSIQRTSIRLHVLSDPVPRKSKIVRRRRPPQRRVVGTMSHGQPPVANRCHGAIGEKPWQFWRRDILAGRKGCGRDIDVERCAFLKVLPWVVKTVVGEGKGLASLSICVCVRERTGACSCSGECCTGAHKMCTGGPEPPVIATASTPADDFQPDETLALSESLLEEYAR